MDENYLDDLLNGMSTNNSKVNNDFEKRIDKDSNVEFDLGDLSDISLEELDDLDNLDLSDLDVDDIDFDDLDITNLNVEKKRTDEEDFNLDALVDETSNQDDFETDTNLSDGDDIFSGASDVFSGADDVFSDADDELMKDIMQPEELTAEAMAEAMAEARNESFAETKTETSAEAMAETMVDEAPADTGNVDNMDIDALFSALGIEESENGEMGTNDEEDINGISKAGDSLDDMFESAALGFDESMFSDIPDIGNIEEDAPNANNKNADGNGAKKKKSFSEILFGEPDEEDIEAQKQALIKKEQKKTKKEEKKAANEEKKAEKAHSLELKKKSDAKAKAEKLEKRKAEYEAELEAEKGQKQVPTPVVIIIFVVFAAVGGLIYFGAQSFHYSQVIKKASDYFERQRYRLAYDEVSGVEVKKSDQELKDRIYTVMYVERLYESFENNLKLGRQDKALDALLRGIQKYDEHYEEAVELGIADDVDFCLSKIEEALKSVYGLNKKQAYNIIALDGKDYIQAITDCCKKFDTGE